jgi:NodT family efflux transporter outer membrane factor (OMF) lipoprotein
VRERAPLGSCQPAQYTRGANVLIGLIALAVLASGCTTVGPDYKTPGAEVESQWLELGDPKISDKPPIDPAWWSVFNDPVLEQLIETAREQNLTLRSAGLRILGARAQLGIALGSKYPQLQQFSGDASRVKLSKNATDNIPLLEDAFSVYNLDFTLAWEIDFWGRFKRLIESAAAQLEASVANYDTVMVALVSEVARTYTLIRTFEDRLRIARENVKTQEQSLKIATVRFRGGVVSELDVAQAQSLLNNTQSAIPVLEITLQQLKNALAVLLGLTPGELGDRLGAPGPIPTAPPQVALGMPQDIIRRRPDIRRAERTLAAQSAQIGVAVSDLYPSFALGGLIGLGTTSIGGKNPGDLFDSDSLTGNAFFGFKWDVFNYGRLKNNVRLQDASFQQLLVDYQNTVLKAQGEVENAIIAYLRTHDQVRFLGGAVTAAQRSVDLATTQYGEGAIDYNRVLTTLNALLLQQDALAVATGSIATNLIATYKALGGGWEIRGDTPLEDLIPEATKVDMRERTKYWNKALPVSSETPPKWGPK